MLGETAIKSSQYWLALVAVIVVILVVRFVPDWTALGMFTFSTNLGSSVWNWVGVGIFMVITFVVIYLYARASKSSKK
jgi:hypothetical protein